MEVRGGNGSRSCNPAGLLSVTVQVNAGHFITHTLHGAPEGGSLPRMGTQTSRRRGFKDMKARMANTLTLETRIPTSGFPLFPCLPAFYRGLSCLLASFIHLKSPSCPSPTQPHQAGQDSLQCKPDHLKSRNPSRAQVSDSHLRLRGAMSQLMTS